MKVLYFCFWINELPITQIVNNLGCKRREMPAVGANNQMDAFGLGLCRSIHIFLTLTFSAKGFVALCL